MKYVTKPIEIDAVNFSMGTFDEYPEWLNDAILDKRITIEGDQFKVETLEGVMTGIDGDFVIMGTEGELYPCKPIPFHKKYKPKDD